MADLKVPQSNRHDEVESVIEIDLSKDAQDMQRMGKTQQFVRHFRLFSMICFTAVLTGAWEFSLFLITPALRNGGSPALLWTMIYNFFLAFPIFLSLAEMASMAPTCGSQYHWVSEFASERYQKILSYITGWTSTLAWQAGNASSALLVGTVVQAMIGIANPEYTAPVWHAVLLTIGDILVAMLANIFGNKFLPHWQYAAFAIHVVAFIGIIAPIWANAPPATSAQVWTEFVNDGGWPNMGLAVLVGQLTAINSVLGLDSSIHMSEEVQHASKTIPIAMLSVYVINFIISFVLYLTLSYRLPDTQAALDDPSFYPAIYVLRQSMSSGWLIAILAITMLLVVASNVTYLTTVTRDLYAFARDKGLPFSEWISKVDSKRHVPDNACYLSSFIAICLSLIYLGSSVAYYALTSLCTVAVFACYIISIACCLWRRVAHPETLPPADFSLGRWGVAVNAWSVIYAVWAFFWCFWPTQYSVDASSFNWSSPVFVVTLLFAVVYYFISGRHHYYGPVVLVEGRNVKAG